MTETTTQTAPAWSNETLEDPHTRDDKARRVQEMFGAIARSYDLNNRVHSLWRDEAWRRAAVRAARVQAGDRVLDLACGTGDLTQAFAKHSRAGSIVGGDFTPEMLDLAEHKRTKLNDKLSGRISYTHADAMDLPFEDQSFDVLSIAFGIRNVQKPEVAIGEMARVLRPGGRLVILEFDTPPFAPVRWFNHFYSGVIMPRTATWIARDRSGAYKYLPKSVETFLSREEMIERLGSAGFAGCAHRGLTLGICRLYSATKR